MTDHITLPRSVLEQKIREAGGIVHGDGNIFFTNVEVFQRAIAALAAAAQAEPVAEPVLVVQKEPDYTSRGHFYEGSKPWVDPTKVWALPIGTKLYTAPQPAQPVAVPHGWRNIIPGRLHTDEWDSARVGDYNNGWNDCQRKVVLALEAAAPTPPAATVPVLEPLTDEQDRALCEAYCNTASDEFFKARPSLDTPENRRIFYAGHRKAWIERDAAKLAKLNGITPPAEGGV